MTVCQETWDDLNRLRHKILTTQQTLVSIRQLLSSQIEDLGFDLDEINRLTTLLEKADQNAG